MPLNPYLDSIDTGDPSGTLPGYLDSSIGGLLGAVPPAGDFITSGDYTTLFPALAKQYVSEVISKYTSILGPTPELYQAAVDAGVMTPEEATAMASESASMSGSLMQKYGGQGGLRAVAGPYQAARTQLLAEALAEVQTATSKASEDAYKLAQMPVQSRIQALAEAGRLGLGLVQAGVSRRNALTAAEAAGPPEQPAMQVPAPPQPPGRPGLWEQILPGLAPVALALLGRQMAPGQPGPEEAGRGQAKMAAAKRDEERKIAEGERATALGYGSREDMVEAQRRDDRGLSPRDADPTSGVMNPYSGSSSFNEDPYAGSTFAPFTPEPAMSMSQGTNYGFDWSSMPGLQSQQPLNYGIDWSQQPQYNYDPYQGQYPGGAGDSPYQGWQDWGSYQYTSPAVNYAMDDYYSWPSYDYSYNDPGAWTPDASGNYGGWY